MGANCACQKDFFKDENNNQHVVNGHPNQYFETENYGNDGAVGEKPFSLKPKIDGISQLESQNEFSTWQEKSTGSKAQIEQFDGDLISGLADGRGREVTKNGDEYIGQFSKGKKHGFGILTKPGYYKYTGNFKEGQIHGYGTMEFDDRSVYKGNFENGLYHGNGSFTKKNGTEQNGNWKEGQFIS